MGSVVKEKRWGEKVDEGGGGGGVFAFSLKL